MSLYMKRLETKMPKNTISSDTSDCENIERENENAIDRNQPMRATVRGNLAALLSNLDNSDSDDSDSNIVKKSSSGLYAKRLNQTKKERKNINHKFFEADKNLITETEESKKNKQNISKNYQENFDIELADSDDAESVNKKKKIEEDYSSESEIEVPLPPPKSNRRKSTSLLYKHFKELESFQIKKDSQILLNDSDRVGFSNDDDDDELNTVTIRVSTKYGLKKWNINKNQSFSFIFEKLADIENTTAENLVLMLKDRIINFSDTPVSINLKAYDILDCGKTASSNQEKVKIVEDGESCEHGSNMVTLILQTDTGRKSRVKFLVSLDEPFESILKKYCEKRELEFDKYLLQMEGDKIELTETPRDLDFEDDYMIDVVKSKKPVLQLVDENKKNYEFDDEILIV